MSDEVKQQAQEVKEEVKTEEVQKGQEKKDNKPQKVEIPKNCGACKKPIQKIRYYRNMQFFCNKRCWEAFKKSAADKDKKEKSQEKAA